MTYPQPHRAILDIKPYIGGEAKAPGVKLHRLASNENPLGSSPKAIEAYKAIAGDLNRYPDGSAIVLREAIAAAHNLPVDRIVCGAGSDELLRLLIMSYSGAGDEVVYSRHGFLMYPLLARLAGATAIIAPELNMRTNPDAIARAITAQTRIVILANPNNPTGSYLTADEMRALQARIPPHVLLIIDAAYAEYVTHADYSAGNDLVDEFQNVIVTRTFSKAYGLANLRIGWCYGPPHIIDLLNRARDPFNVNGAAIAAGAAAMGDQDFVAASRDMNARMLPWLAQRLKDMHYHPYPSAGNFLLVAFPPHSAEELRLYLKNRGVLVRQMGAYGLAECLRITIGPQDAMEAVVDGVHAFQKENPAE
jgi:histidinol-phosphate aminotransferase